MELGKIKLSSSSLMQVDITTNSLLHWSVTVQSHLKHPKVLRVLAGCSFSRGWKIASALHKIKWEICYPKAQVLLKMWHHATALVAFHVLQGHYAIYYDFTAQLFISATYSLYRCKWSPNHFSNYNVKSIWGTPDLASSSSCTHTVQHSPKIPLQWFLYPELHNALTQLLQIAIYATCIMNAAMLYYTAVTP